MTDVTPSPEELELTEQMRAIAADNSPLSSEVSPEALEPTAVAELAAWCAGDDGDTRLIESLGFVKDGYITDEGIEYAQSNGILLRQVSMLKLGVPVTVYTKGNKVTPPVRVVLREGSKLLVTFGGYNKRGKRTRYWEVYISEDFDIQIIQEHPGMVIETDFWPMGRPIPTHFLTKAN